ncbi:MAG: pilin [bacterium]|nr:pilin [bacterium]
MRRIIIILLLISLTVIVLFPATSHAALVPCGRSDQGGTMCTLCDLVVGVKGLIDFGFKIMVIVAIVMITIAGVLYIISTGETSMMENAKGMLKNTLIGFAIILGGWLMINTLMWVMGTKGAGDKGGVLGINVTNWYTFTCKK